MGKKYICDCKIPSINKKKRACFPDNANKVRDTKYIVCSKMSIPKTLQKFDAGSHLKIRLRINGSDGHLLQLLEAIRF